MSLPLPRLGLEGAIVGILGVEIWDEDWKWKFGQLIKSRDARLGTWTLIHSGEPFTVVEGGHDPFWKTILSAA